MDLETKFELGKLRNGGVSMLCNSELPKHVEQVEYYQDCKIFILTFFSPQNGEESLMIQYELKDKSAKVIEEAQGDQILLVDASNTRNPIGYLVPLIRLGPSFTTH
jgi:hypothetical protein